MLALIYRLGNLFGKNYKISPRAVNILWLLAGDFNETSSLDERNHGGPDMQRRCNRFTYWIENNGLLDLGYSGPKFTWSRGLSPGTRKEARLNRALCNAQWRLKFQEGAVRHLVQVGSDHSPLLIATGGFVRPHARKTPFWFQAVWTSQSHLEQLIQDTWCPIASLSRNLQHLASTLAIWNREVFGNLFFRKRHLWARIKGIQRALNTGGPLYLRKLEYKLRAELDHTLDQLICSGIKRLGLIKYEMVTVIQNFFILPLSLDDASTALRPCVTALMTGNMTQGLLKVWSLIFSKTCSPKKPAVILRSRSGR